MSVKVKCPIGQVRLLSPHVCGADDILQAAHIPQAQTVQVTVKSPNFVDQCYSQSIAGVDSSEQTVSPILLLVQSVQGSVYKSVQELNCKEVDTWEKFENWFLI